MQDQKLVGRSLPVLDCTPLLSGSPLDEAAAARLAAALRVLADPGRLRIVSLIQAQPSGEACVCHLTDALGLAQPTVSHHLRVLFKAGVLERERRANWIYYRLVPGALADIREALGGQSTTAAPGPPAVVGADAPALSPESRREHLAAALCPSC